MSCIVLLSDIPACWSISTATYLCIAPKGIPTGMFCLECQTSFSISAQFIKSFFYIELKKYRAILCKKYNYV